MAPTFRQYKGTVFPTARHSIGTLKLTLTEPRRLAHRYLRLQENKSDETMAKIKELYSLFSLFVIRRRLHQRRGANRKSFGGTAGECRAKL